MIRLALVTLVTAIVTYGLLNAGYELHKATAAITDRSALATCEADLAAAEDRLLQHADLAEEAERAAVRADRAVHERDVVIAAFQRHYREEHAPAWERGPLP